jgi:hypothetical protein
MECEWMECMSASIVMGPTDHGYGDGQTNKASQALKVFRRFFFVVLVRLCPGIVKSGVYPVHHSR